MGNRGFVAISVSPDKNNASAERSICQEHHSGDYGQIPGISQSKLYRGNKTARGQSFQQDMYLVFVLFDFFLQCDL